MLDTNIAIRLRDGDMATNDAVDGLADSVLLSVVTRVELEAGVYRVPEKRALRRARLDVILATIPVLAFDDDAAAAYGAIVARTGYSRRKAIDRMIAAHAIARGVPLITLNPTDFRDIPGLDVVVWQPRAL